MSIFSATLGSFGAISFLSLSHSQQQQQSDTFNFFPKCPSKLQYYRHNHNHDNNSSKIMCAVSSSSSSNDTQIDEFDNGLLQRPSAPNSLDSLRQARRSSDWKAANAYRDSGLIYNGRVEGINTGGLLLRFYSIMGFLPYPQLSPSHSCKEPNKPIQEIAKDMLGSILSVKVIDVDEETRKLVLSEKKASWSKYSKYVNIGDIFIGRVCSVEDYGAFIELRFPDGLYHLTGLIHISEVSWDLVQDVRDFLTKGEELEEDPLLETLDKVIPQDGSASPDSFSDSIKPLPGLETILDELLQEDGIFDARISRQGFEKRVVSQDLQLWLSNAPPMEQRFTLLARAGRQEILLKTSLDQEGIKKAIQRVLERVP
ncbi:hypothetical protein TSUD_322110 [Trifolium subterraneum]|uniref:S1 motif domain-containing protein n=1 Tax=Trifolium subterraneum TaxID=3900 RepID=A0A2Z6MEL1_TRISU|nr:hypothetical protein TSUD_322110 [Trifolium subterraneum]